MVRVDKSCSSRMGRVLQRASCARAAVWGCQHTPHSHTLHAPSCFALCAHTHKQQGNPLRDPEVINAVSGALAGEIGVRSAAQCCAAKRRAAARCRRRQHPPPPPPQTTKKGARTATFVCPLDVLKTRLQVQRIGAAARPGIAASLADIARAEGMGGLYRGLTPTLLALLPNWAVYFTVYGRLKTTLTTSSTGVCLFCSLCCVVCACGVMREGAQHSPQNKHTHKKNKKNHKASTSPRRRASTWPRPPAPAPPL